MGDRKNSWWEHIRRHWIVAIIISLVIAAMVLILVESLINGTGFNGYNQVTIAHTISGPSAGTVIRTEVSQPGKTLWDWLQLLFIPAVLAIGALLFNRAVSKNEQEIATDNQQETIFQEYLNRMSELLLEKNLRASKSGDDVRSIARARTLTLLQKLDGVRKGSLLQFLYEAKLITGDENDVILHLQVADLNRSNLTRIFLNGVNLTGADLNEAILHRTKLTNAILELTILKGANLRNAELIRANLSQADLSSADLSEAILIGANLSGALQLHF